MGCIIIELEFLNLRGILNISIGNPLILYSVPCLKLAVCQLHERYFYYIWEWPLNTNHNVQNQIKLIMTDSDKLSTSISNFLWNISFLRAFPATRGTSSSTWTYLRGFLVFLLLVLKHFIFLLLKERLYINLSLINLGIYALSNLVVLDWWHR